MLKGLVLLFILFLVFIPVEAKRMGGGNNLGKPAHNNNQQNYQRNENNQTNNQTNNQSNRNNNTNTQNPQGNRMPGWLGPLGGLLAGGLFAALLFGGGFSGFQPFDFILLLVIGLGVFFLIKMLLRKPTASTFAYSGSTSQFQEQSQSQNFAIPTIGANLNEDKAIPLDTYPSWFDKASFLEAGKTHFIRLQAAWDRADMKDIREYTTPDLFAQLSLERQKIGSTENFTEVVELNSALLGLYQDGDLILANIRYSGLIREQANADAQPFSEIWVIQRDMSMNNANWYIAGIQQEN